MNNYDLIQRIKKILSFICAIGIWWAGMYLSFAGFNFNVRDMAWIGWALAFAVTVTELVFNSQLSYKHSNFTIYILGVTSYIYDVGSNFAGIWLAQNHNSFNDIATNIPTALFCLAASFFIAVLPETLMIYSLVGIGSTGEGDFLKNLLGMRENSQSNHYSNPHNNSQQQGHSPYPVPAGFIPINRQSIPQQGQSNKHKNPKQTFNPTYQNLNRKP